MKECLAREHSAFIPPAGSRVPRTVLNLRSLVFKNIFPHPKPNKNPPKVPNKVSTTHITTFLIPPLVLQTLREAAGRMLLIRISLHLGSKPAPEVTH